MPRLRSLRRRRADTRPPDSTALTYISVEELTADGLDNHPNAVGIYWPNTEAVICREHAVEPIALTTVAMVGRNDMRAIVLGARPGAATHVRSRCQRCRLRSHRAEAGAK